jgi:hypothetical protein
MFSLKKNLASCILITTCINASADTGSVTGTLDRVLIDQSNFAGCMGYVSQDIRTQLPACNSNWVTFDCSALFPETTKQSAQNKLSQAQLALVSGKQVYVVATDARKVNGYCLATRIDVIQ